MSVLGNVTLGPRKALGLSRADAEQRADELLARFGLEDKRGAYPDSLSGGQQQRVAIVRALALRPKLMLLDEITSALDPELVAEVLNVVRELAQGGMTMLIATHEMVFARDIADRVCFLDEGVILEEGPPDADLLRSPRAAHPAVPCANRRSRQTVGVVEKQHEHHLSVSLEPLDDFLLIEPGDAETWTRSGLIVPAGADQGCRTGIVTAVGPDANGIEPGDKVLFPKDAGYDVRIGAGTVKLLDAKSSSRASSTEKRPQEKAKPPWRAAEGSPHECRFLEGEPAVEWSARRVVRSCPERGNRPPRAAIPFPARGEVAEWLKAAPC